MKKTMFGKYFKHILILTFLAGMAYSLPQVKDAMADAFSIPGFNPALAISAMVSSDRPMPIKTPMPTPQSMMQGGANEKGNVYYKATIQPQRRMISPSELIMLLFKAGVIPQDKLPLAIKIVKEHYMFGTSTPPMYGTTTPPMHGTSTPPMMLYYRDYKESTSTKPRIMMYPPMQPKPINTSEQDKSIEVDSNI